MACTRRTDPVEGSQFSLADADCEGCGEGGPGGDRLEVNSTVLPRTVQFIRNVHELERWKVTIRLYDKETDAALGVVSERQLQLLADQLEEEAGDDQDYYINEETIETLEAAGADSGLLLLLRNALSGRTEMEIRWARG